jgi:hypothetical protein
MTEKRTLAYRWRVSRRKAYLRRLLNTANQVQMAWMYELSYLERTGRLDWVNPLQVTVRPAGSSIKPSPRPRS